MGLQGIGYKVDIAFVIDATGSMGPIMSQMKERAITLGDEIKAALKEAGKEVSEMRLRVIDYGDYSSEGDDAIRQTDFFKMPDEKAAFDSAVNSIQYEGRGGDDPENGLEALYVAMSSEWVKIKGSIEKGRHIIVLMTDAYPLNLQERDGCRGYQSDAFPPDVNALQAIWDENENSQSCTGKSTKLSYLNRRLVLFAPEGSDELGHSWSSVASWENASQIATTTEGGLTGVDLSGIIAEIVRSC